MKAKLLFILFALIFISGCIQQPAGEFVKKVSFTAEDGVAIVGNYWSGSDTAVLLLHMMPATKESWNDFADALNKEGMTVLAIDLRGHGESIKQGSNTLNYIQFSDEQHQASIKDVEAAVGFLKQNGSNTIYIAGASIGANLALQYQANHLEVKKTILLSAGLNYRGVLTQPSASALSSDQAVFLIAGTKDDSAADMANQLASSIKGPKQVKIYDTSAHGTDLFNVDPNLISTLVDWLKS